MLELTRDGGLLNSEELQEMMRKQVEEYDRSRVMQVASEYFCLSSYDDSNDSAGAIPTHRNSRSDVSLAKDQPVIEALDGSSEEPTTGVCSKALAANIHTWLVSEADAGDEDAQYLLARFFSAPPFIEDSECSVCRSSFGITLFRHHCRFCGCSVCHLHSMQRRCIFRSLQAESYPHAIFVPLFLFILLLLPRRYGMVQPVRVCDACSEIIDETQRRDSLLWKNLRVEAFLKHRLIPYFHPSVDRNIDKAIRCNTLLWLATELGFR